MIKMKLCFNTAAEFPDITNMVLMFDQNPVKSSIFGFLTF